MALQNGVSMTIIIRLQMIKNTVYFIDIVNAIGQAGGDVIGIDVIQYIKEFSVRDITVNVIDQKHSELIVESVRKLEGIRVINVSDRTFLVHLGGKIEIIIRAAYQSGVARRVLGEIRE